MRFSERYGFKQVKNAIQLESMDEDLRNAIWNALTICYWEKAQCTDVVNKRYNLSSPSNEQLQTLCFLLWIDYFKKPLDKKPNDWKYVNEIIREYYFKCEWHEVYDFIEFIVGVFPDDDTNRNFIIICNSFLEREMSAFRFVDKKIAKIVSEEEITSIEDAIRGAINPVREHISRSLQLLADRKSPDYRNSIKESISAVESLVKLVIGNERASLGELLKIFEREKNLHPALKSAFSSLYGYTSDEGGIRHALLDRDRVSFDEAKFMLVACSAFINYILAGKDK